MSSDGAMVYIAAAVENYQGEGEKYNCTRYIIEKGEYLAEPVTQWHEKTNCINSVFHSMMKDDRTD